MHLFRHRALERPLTDLIEALKQGANRLLGRRPVPAEELAYRRLRDKGFSPGAIVDVGAYKGDWTRLARRVFRDVPVLMVEPQASKRPHLEGVCRDLDGVRYVQALIGRRSGETTAFFEMETGSSIFPERSDVPRVRSNLPTVTLDELAGALPGPLMLKVDVQGAELEVLAGGLQTLARCEVVQLEVPIVPYNEGAPTMLEVMGYMAERGFVPLDISGYSRPNGVDLAQIDVLFVPGASRLRTTFFQFT